METFAFLLALAALIWAARSRSAVNALEEKVSNVRREFNRFEQRLDKIFAELKILHEDIRRLDAVRPASAPDPAPAKPTVAPEIAVAPPPPPIVVPPTIVATETIEPIVQAPPAAALPPPEPPRREPPPPPRPPVPPPPPKARFDWEALIGVKLFSWIAGIALVFAAVFFLKYSVDHGWLSPPIRMAIGLLTGAALLVVCEWKAARRYAVTANALDAAGIAILFSTFFAAHALWNLLDVIPTFAFMAMVTAVAVLLSIRHDSAFVALLGMVGGFATPALLSTGDDRPIGLFSYLLLLNAGLDWVAYKKRWPYLTALSVIFTTIYQWGWVMKFLQTGNLPLAAGIFLVFPVLSFLAIALGEKGGADKESKLFQQTAAISFGLPHLFALYLAAVPAYGNHYWLLFGFLFLMDAGLAAIAVLQGPEILHMIAGISTVVVLTTWLQMSYTSAAWPAILAVVSLFVLLYLAVPHLMTKLGRNFTDFGNKAVFAAPLLLVAFPALAAIEGATASPGILFGALFALMAVVAVHAIVREEGAVHFIAAFFALAAEAVWSAKHLEPQRLLSALSIYAVFGLFYLGVPLAARRWNKRLQPEGSGAIVLFVSLGLLFFLAAGPVASSALWGIALLLTILNLGLFAEASAKRPFILIAGLLLSWVVIGVWWNTVSLSALLVPGLAIVAGFAVMILGGNIWVARRAEAGGQSSLIIGQGLYLALVGHAFLLFVAVQKPLSIPPWPFLGVLVVLDLAIGVAALYTKQGELHLGALAASQAILVSWELTVEAAPWPRVAILSALGIAAFGLAWSRLAVRTRTESAALHTFVSAGSVLASALGMVVLIAAETLTGSPDVALLTAASVLFLCFILAQDWFAYWRFLSPSSVLLTASALLVWQSNRFTTENWIAEFVFAAAIYVVYLAYPLLMGYRAVSLLEPYLGAVLASASFFYFARHSLMAGGYADRIGLLPVAQAALMAGLLWRLLKLEPPGERTLGRLALVAGSGLAFITVAIPLQLEKQWITIGWALQAAALAWLCRRIPHKGLVVWTTGLLAAVFARLVLNPAVFTYHPRGATPIWNWYLYTYLVAAAAFFVAAWFLRDQKEMAVEPIPPIRTLATAGGTILLFLLVNIEIADFYSKGPTLTFNFNAGIAQDLTYTIGWGLFAFGLLIAGIVLRSKPARLSAIILLSVTIAKCFLHDLWRLGGLYRVGSFVGLAVCLTLVALLLQKFVMRPQKEAE